MTTKKFPANFQSLASISDFVVKSSEKAGFSPTDVYAIQTAVDEACSNIIDHAYGGEDIGDIQIEVTQVKMGSRSSSVMKAILSIPMTSPHRTSPPPRDPQRTRFGGFLHA